MNPIIKLSDDQTIHFLNKQLYQPHKFVSCNIHHLPKQYICILKKCPQYTTPNCRECHTQHPLLAINKIVPKLAQWAKDEWTTIQKDHKHVESQWKICLVNVNYCLDILKEVKKQIEERTQNIELGVFKQLLAEIHSMFTHDSNNVSVEMLLRNFQRLNQRFELITGEDKVVTCVASDEQREHLRNKVKQACQKTKTFSQKALAFSETLARIIQEKIRGEKRVGRLKELSNNRIFNLKDLLKEQADMKEVSELMIELPKFNKNDKDEPVITEILDKCHNLKSLRINNKNGAIQKYRWRKIILGMEYLKFLKQLVLNIHSSDLNILTELFKERSKAVRQVEKLTLHITDEKDLNVVDVYNFVNTMQLRNLNLTLSRDNLGKGEVLQLLKGLRTTTSMSQLPLNQLNLNLNKNKINQGTDAIEITAYFNQRAQNIKQKSIVL